MKKIVVLSKMFVILALALTSCSDTKDFDNIKEKYLEDVNSSTSTRADNATLVEVDNDGNEVGNTPQDGSVLIEADKAPVIHAKEDSYLSVSGKVLKVISGTEIEVQTDRGIVFVAYAGILIPDSRRFISQTAKDFNEFLVQNKEVEIEYLKSNNIDGNEKKLKGFVFSSGELINLRLIESGLVVTDDSFEFGRKSRFKEAQEYAIKLKLGIWDKDLGSICGTLPC